MEKRIKQKECVLLLIIFVCSVFLCMGCATYGEDFEFGNAFNELLAVQTNDIWEETQNAPPSQLDPFIAWGTWESYYTWWEDAGEEKE